MAGGQRWKFTQVTAGRDAGGRLSFTLEGASAPHGRPRHGAVVTDGLQLRHSATYYSGRARPTRHIFGSKHTPWSLKGRFMDRVLGPGGANAKMQYVKAFIDAAVACHIEWGAIGAWTGLIVGISCERESPSQIAYTIDIEIDSDDTMPSPAVVSSPSNALESAQKLLTLLGPVTALPQKIPGDIEFQSNFLDSIDNVISQISAVTGALVDIANDIDSFEEAAASELNRLRGVIGQLKTALVILNGTLDDVTGDGPVERASDASQTEWAQAREAERADVLSMLLLIADIDAQAEQALRGRAQKTSHAVEGDSWESLARQHYGSSDKADALRQANGARYGEQPVAGKTIHVPKP